MANAEAEKSFEAFKVPQLLKHNESVITSNADPETSVISKETLDEADKEILEPKNVKSKKLIDVPLPYKEPSWSGVPPDDYSLEIIKNGAFLEMFNLKSSLVVFGRLDVCDIKFEHPSVSRFHAVIQYCSGDSTHAQGFYLYDLGSTHGTFLNKEKITPKVYYKLKVGYIVKFGGSMRLHIFQGPEEEDQEVEKPKSPQVEEICSWGISEDANEDEDMTENPFALSTPNEELYLDDPKKTLRGWFEREGYEVEYDVEEKGFKTFSCKVQLPIDTPTGDFMTVEASVSGKKKEAVIACALEACRTLDRLGLLRQSHQESRQRKKKKKWEENDYYDSDEDTFLDRTGTIEKKREMRKRIEKKPEAETFESIESKLKAVTAEIDEITRKLSTGKNDVQAEKNAEDDSLEEYMSTLSDSKDMASDKIERRKLKFRLVQVEKEKSHLEKLLEIVRPTKLPPAIKYPGMIGKRIKSKFPKVVPKMEGPVPVPKLNENEEEMEEDSDVEIETSNSESAQPPVSKIIKDSGEVTDTSNSTPTKSSILKPIGDLVKVPKTSSPIKTISMISNPVENSVEFAEVSRSIPSKSSVSITVKDSDVIAEIPDSISDEISDLSSVIDEDAEKPKTYGLILTNAKNDYKPGSPISVKKPDSSTTITKLKEFKTPDSSSQAEDSDVPVPKKRKKGRKKQTEFENDLYTKESEEYSTWVPPSGQTGDGMTHLNSKYGY